MVLLDRGSTIPLPPKTKLVFFFFPFLAKLVFDLDNIFPELSVKPHKRSLFPEDKKEKRESQDRNS